MSNLMEKSTALYQELPLFQEKIQQLAAVMKVKFGRLPNRSFSF